MYRVEIWNKEDWERRFDTEPYVSGVSSYCKDQDEVLNLISIFTKSGNVCVVEQPQNCRKVEQ